MRSKSKKRIQSISSVVDSHNSDAATLETESESDFNLDADNESMGKQPALDSQVVNSMEQQQFTNIINKAREMQDHAARSREGLAEASAATTTTKKNATPNSLSLFKKTTSNLKQTSSCKALGQCVLRVFQTINHQIKSSAPPSSSSSNSKSKLST